MCANWTLRQAKQYLKTIDHTISRTSDDELRVVAVGDGEAQAYYTTDMQDAIETAEAVYHGFIEARRGLTHNAFREIVDRIDREYAMTTREVRMQARKKALDNALTTK